jgi:hypothetical protein
MTCPYSYADEEYMTRILHSMIEKGEKVMVLTHGKEKLDELMRGVQHKFPDKNVVYYNADTPKDVKRKDFEDVNVSWKDKDVVGFNSTCEAGISCVLPYFKNSFGFFTPSIGVAVQPTLQMVGRNRPMQVLHLHVDNKRMSLEYVKSFPIERGAIFDKYVERYKTDGDKIPENLELDFTKDGLTIGNTSFKQVIYTIQRHANASRLAFESLFIERCAASGMTIMDKVGNTCLKDMELAEVVKAMAVDEREIKALRIANAPEITHDQHQILRYSMSTTQIEQDSIAKYQLSTTYAVDVCDVDKKFVLKYNNQYAINANMRFRSIQKYGDNVHSSIEQMKIDQGTEAGELCGETLTKIYHFAAKNDVKGSIESAIQSYQHSVGVEVSAVYLICISMSTDIN